MIRVSGKHLPPILVLASISLFAMAAHSQTQSIASNGQWVPSFGGVPVGSLNAGSTGTIVLYTQAGVTVNPAPPGQAGFVNPTPFRAPITGGSWGKTSPKFTALANGGIQTNRDFGWARSTITNVFGNTTTANASARWDGVLTTNANGVISGYGSQHTTRALVTNNGFINRSGYAVSQAYDPWFFNGSGTVTYTATLGPNATSSSVIPPFPDMPASDGSDMGNDFGLASNADQGYNLIYLSASFSGVMINSRPLNGDLFALAISSQGVTLTPGSLEVDFTPWSGLGLSTSQITSIEGQIQSAMQVRSDGSLGLVAPLDLFGTGPGALLAPVSIDFNPNSIYFDEITTVAAVPEPTVTLMLSAGVCSSLIFCLRRRLPPKTA